MSDQAQPTVQELNPADAEFQELMRDAQIEDGLLDSPEEDPEKKDQDSDDPESKPEDAPENKDEDPNKPEDDARANEDDDDAKLSKYQKSQKRLNKSWQNLEQEKEALRRQREEVDQIRSKLEQEQKRVQDEARRNAPTAKDFEAIAEDAENNGDFDKAERARKLAQHAREQEQAQAQAQTQAQQQFKSQWNENLKRVLDANPDMKEQNSELGKAVQQVLQEEPILSRMPDGIVKATHIAKMTLQAQKSESLAKENAELKAKIEELSKKLSIDSSNPTSRQSTRTTPMNVDDEIRMLEEDARRADGYA